MKIKAIARARLLPIVALIAMVLLASAASVQASSASQSTGKHLIAMASWSMVDGDVTTEVFISACMQHSRLSISIYQFGPETFTPLLEANGELPDTAFSIDKKLTEANLDGTVTVFDWLSMENITVTLNIEWTSIGSMSKSSNNWHFKSADFFESGYMKDVYREAIAIGEISNDLTINLSESDLMYAQLDSYRAHSVMKHSDDIFQP